MNDVIFEDGDVIFQDGDVDWAFLSTDIVLGNTVSFQRGIGDIDVEFEDGDVEFVSGDVGFPTETFADLSEIVSITGPKITRAAIDVTSLDSTGGYRELIKGLMDSGKIYLTMNFVKDLNYMLLKDDFESNTPVNYKMILDNGNTEFIFSGLVTELTLKVTPDDKVSSSAAIKISNRMLVNTNLLAS